MMSQSVVENLRIHYGVTDEWLPESVRRAMKEERIHIRRSVQNELFDKTLREFGARALLSAAGALASERQSPIQYILLNVDTPRQCIEKLIRLKQFLHSFAKMDVLRESSNSITVNHYFREGSPQPGEDLYTFGAVQLLLIGAGCLALQSRWVAVSHRDLLRYDEVAAHDPKFSTETVWEFQWESFRPNRTYVEGLDDVLMQGLPPLPEGEDLSSRLRALVAGNLDRKWPIVEAAERLFLSPRSLQRKLREENSSFSRILSSLRLTQAKHMLAETDYSITEIGFSLGFSDTAHFSRVFKQETGRKPSEFRRRLLPMATTGALRPNRPNNPREP